MFRTLGRLAYRRSWYIIGVWLVLMGVGTVFTIQLSSVLKPGGFDAPTADYFVAQKRIADNLGAFRSEIIAVFTVPQGQQPTDPAFARQIDEAVAGARNYPDTKTVLTYLTTQEAAFNSRDGRYTMAIIGLNSDVDKTQENLKQIHKTLKPGSLEMRLTGTAEYYETVTKVSEEDVARGELLAFPLALIVLLIVFRTLVAAVLPLVMAGGAIVTALGIMYFVAQGVDLSVFVLNIATLLGLGLSIDYSLLIISRFREELHKSNGKVEVAIETTLNTAGRAVFFSGLTVVIGMSSLFIFDLELMRSIGIGGIMVVLAGMVASLTLLPAILALLGHRINSLKIPFVKPVNEVLSDDKRGFWRNASEWVMKRPLVVLLVTVSFLLLLGSPMLHLRFGTSSFEILPTSNPVRQATEILNNNFPNASKNSDVTILVEAQKGQMSDPVNVAALYDYTRKLKQNGLVNSVSSPVDLPSPVPLTKELYQQLLSQYATNPAGSDPRLVAALQTQLKGNLAVVKLDTNIKYATVEGADYVKSLRVNPPDGLKILVAGQQARLLDFVNAIYSVFPLAILLVIILSYITLLLMFQSVVLPIKAVFMTGVSLTASYGSMVWLFQDGNLSGLLGFTPQGYVEAALPILLFAILFGLSMDYEVFLLTRVNEIYRETGDNTHSVAEGVGRTAGIITSAAFILIMVALGFALAAIVAVKAIGIGMAIAVAVDATIVRGLLVPATMKLLGDWNWWAPGFVKRYLPKLKLE